MLFRLLGYMVRIWEDFRRANKEAPRLPAIIPVVVHHGEGGWRAAMHFAELLDLEPAEYDELAAFVPNFTFVLDFGRRRRQGDGFAVPHHARRWLQKE